MTFRANCWGRALRALAVTAALAGLCAAGCGKRDVPQPEAKAPDVPPPPDDGFHQPFAKAARRSDDPPAECNRPPDTTHTGKTVYKIYKEVTRLWDTVRYRTPEGRRLSYAATLETDLGPVVIELRPDVAPNHVRNFVALAKAGYYDGMFFDRVRHEESDDPATGARLDTVEAGCPLGTGEMGYGSIGYWLNPEFDDKEHPKLPHDEGTVGAVHGFDPDTAACRFYITLNRAPFLDGNYTAFGKVVHGLDVVRKIHQQPASDGDQEPDGSRRPLKPVVIRKVTIRAEEAPGTEGKP
jgi:peptidyl-prolyl cis-trans isomerase B (cyclophilin B)